MLGERFHRPQALIVAGVIAFGCAAGASIPAFVGAVGDKPAHLAILPALAVLGLLVALSRRVLLLLIVLARASGDLLFEQSRISIAGYEVGVGGLINAFVLLIAVLLVMEKPAVVPRRFVASVWAGFLFVALYGVAVSPAPADAIRVYLALISYLAVFVSAFYFVRVPADFRFCVRIVLLSSIVPAIYALADIALHWQSGGLEGFRLQSTFTHPNIFAFYLTLVVSVVLYMLKSDSAAVGPGTRIGLSAYLVYLLGLLILTQTRSAWIACLALFAVYAVLFERRYLSYLVAVPLTALLIPGVQDRLLDLTQGNAYAQYAKLNSFAWRRLMWEAGIQWMQPDHYLLGYGLESFKHFSTEFFPLAGKTSWGAHSVYVQTFFELGILGLLAFLWLFGRLLHRLGQMVSCDRLAAVVSISLTVEFLTVSFSDNMFAYLAFNWYLWFLLGAGCALVQTGMRIRDGASATAVTAPVTAATEGTGT